MMKISRIVEWVWVLIWLLRVAAGPGLARAQVTPRD